MGRTSSMVDAAYRVLADRRRRAVLVHLAAADRRLTLNDLAKEIAVRESDAPITELSNDRLTRVYQSLHHVHAPKLADEGFVEYDRKRSAVEPTDRFDRLLPFLRVTDPELADETGLDERLVP